MIVSSATPAELDVATLYGLLRLRVDVFVVEQHCPYPELDGRDLEPGARHWWIVEEAAIVACMRTLVEPDGSQRIGRVATAPAARGRGLAAALLRGALEELPRPVVLSAQSHLADWYASFGFRVAGEAFVEDGIPHVPMRLT